MKAGSILVKNYDGEIPLPQTKLNVAIVGNLKQHGAVITKDEEAEYDNPETVEAIKKALQKINCKVSFVEANELLPQNLKKKKIDFVFNIAEGKGGRGREAQVPAILNMMGIPYTGSDETTLCISLDKALTKRILSTYKVKTPKYIVVTKENRNAIGKLNYPVIIKPNSEGSSKGISDKSIACSKAELKAILDENLSLYDQDMLIEEYVEGGEFTVGVLGNGKNIKVFTPMEIVYKRPTQDDFHVYSYTVKQDYTKFVDYVCPPVLDEDVQKDMMKISKKIYKALGCRDFSRMDFRLDKDNKIYFIEINPLPGLAPSYSDYPMLAEFCGMEYNTLVQEIFKCATQRYASMLDGRE